MYLLQGVLDLLKLNLFWKLKKKKKTFQNALEIENNEYFISTEVLQKL